MTSPGLQALQLEAYSAVCRAFYAQQSLQWEQEDVLTKLREFWNISNQTHSSITQEMRSDPDVVAVRGGGMPSRLGRTQTGVGAAAPAPSLGAAAPYGQPHHHQQYAQQYAYNPAVDDALMPPPARRARATASSLPAFSDHSMGSPEVSAMSDDSDQSRQQRRAKKSGRKGGGGGSKSRAAAPSGMQQAASMRRAPSRPAVGAGVSGGAVARVPSGIGRSRSTRANGGYGGADPNDYVGRRVWRLWPTENPPWVEGFVQGWDPDTGMYTVVYDPNTRESTEEQFAFSHLTEGPEYVMGEYVDMTAVHGSRRQHEKPWVSPEAYNAPAPAGLLAALAPPPSKKRKSTSGVPVPADAPFELTYLNARLPVAQEDELQQMLAVLERKEQMVEAEINILEYQEANREDIEKRTALEKRFQELCDREAALMAEIATLRKEVEA